MRTTSDYLDLCKTNKKLKNDSELAKYLGISRASISVIRKGGGLAQDTALKLSQGSGEPIESIWLANLTQREQNPVFKKALENISKNSGYAANIFLVISPFNSDIYLSLSSKMDALTSILC